MEGVCKIKRKVSNEICRQCAAAPFGSPAGAKDQKEEKKRRRRRKKKSIVLLLVEFIYVLIKTLNLRERERERVGGRPFFFQFHDGGAAAREREEIEL